MSARSDDRIFGLSRFLPEDLIPEEGLVKAAIDRAHDELLAGVEREGYVIDGPFHAELKLVTMGTVSVPQPWWRRVLHLPLRYVDAEPVRELRLSVRCRLSAASLNEERAGR